MICFVDSSFIHFIENVLKGHIMIIIVMSAQEKYSIIPTTLFPKIKLIIRKIRY